MKHVAQPRLCWLKRLSPTLWYITTIITQFVVCIYWFPVVKNRRAFVALWW